MANPFDRATSSAPPTLGEGCTARYDPSALSDSDGTDFPDAQALWKAVQAGASGTGPSNEPNPTVGTVFCSENHSPVSLAPTVKNTLSGR